MTESTAKLAGGRYLTARFADFAYPKKHKKPEKTAKEIADNVIKGLCS